MDSNTYIDYVAHMLDESFSEGSGIVSENDQLVKYSGDLDNLLIEADSGIKLVYDIPKQDFQKFLKNSKITNKYFQFDQNFSKFITNGGDMPSGEYFLCGLFKGRKLKAYACVTSGSPSGHTYIECYQALQNGYGKPLLQDLCRAYGRIWLFAAITGGEKLFNYYRQPCFNFKEYLFKELKRGKYVFAQHCFAGCQCDMEKIARLVKKVYNAVPIKDGKYCEYFDPSTWCVF